MDGEEDAKQARYGEEENAKQTSKQCAIRVSLTLNDLEGLKDLKIIKGFKDFKLLRACYGNSGSKGYIKDLKGILRCGIGVNLTVVHINDLMLFKDLKDIKESKNLLVLRCGIGVSHTVLTPAY